MNYAQVFEKMPSALISELNRQPWLKDYTSSGQSLPELLASEIYMQELMDRMAENELKALRYIVMDVGCRAFSGEELERLASASMSGAEIRASLVALRRYGIIVAMRKSWGEQILFLPQDGFEVWHALLLQGEEESAAAPPEELDILNKQGFGSRGLAQDLLHLMSYAASYELPLTQKGSLNKKQVTKLHELLRIKTDEEPTLPISWRFSEVYGLKLSVLLDVSFRMFFLHGTSDKLLINKEPWSLWLKKSFEQQQTDLYLLWKSYFFPAELWLQHSMLLIENMPKGQWSSIDQVISWLERNIRMEHVPQGYKQQLLQTWLMPLQMFGWLELAQDRSNTIWFRRFVEARLPVWQQNTNDSDALPCIYVQPDFELLLPPEAPPFVEWEIASFSDVLGSDQVRTYRITKESVHRACEAGQSWEGIIAFLKRYSLYEIADSVLVTLEQWGRQYGTLYFAEVVLLRCHHAELAKRIAESERCQHFLLGKLGEQDLLVRGEYIQEFRKQLEKIGIYPKKSVEAMKGKAQGEANLTFNHNGLFATRDPLRIYDLEPALHSMEDIYPDFQEVPALWLKEYRAYHTSTRKDLIRKAIEWKSLLKLRKAGEDCYIAPRALAEDQAGWTLVGREATREVRLRLGDWDEMQLILPGINGP